jgi:hypothetical protein
MRFNISDNETPANTKGPGTVLRITKIIPGIPGQMSVGTCIILGMTETWTKNTYACDPDECDTLIEVTSSDKFGFPSGSIHNVKCPCGRTPNLLSVEPATITPTETKGNTMEETTTIGSDALHSPAVEYNPNLLVTYKVLHGYSDPEYTTSKVTSLEWDLHNGRQSQKRVGLLESNINTVKDIILEAYPDSADPDTLQAIAEALNIELTKDVEFTATIEVSGTITLNLLEDYDLESEITDSLYVDANNGNIQIDDTEVCHVREAY